VQERAVRVAFVGAPERLAGSTHDAASGGVEPHLLSLAGGGAPEPLHARLSELNPDVVVALGAAAPTGALAAGLPALTFGFLAEPAEPGWERFDRVIAANETLAADAERAGVEIWRVLPLPVADRFFRPALRPTGAARVLDVDAALEPQQLHKADVAVHRTSDTGPEMDHAVLGCMSAGLLVVSGPLPSLPWLEPDIDFVEAGSDARITHALGVLREDPAAFHRQRLGGRLKAERMRASSVWSRLVGDLGRDVGAFGRGR
jgi:hypothetical protein